MLAHAIVATDRPHRYAKQLVSHMGHTCPTEEIEGGHRLTLFREGPVTGWFDVLVVAPADGEPDADNERLVLVARADDSERLARVEDVVARHLVRFGAADELTVEWVDGDLPDRH